MARHTRSHHTFLSLLLVYSLTLSIYAPLPIGQVEAAPLSSPNETAPPLSSATKPAKKKVGYRDGEILVRFYEEATEEEKDALIESKGARRARILRGNSGVLKLTLKAGQSPEAVASEFRANRIVQMVEPNYLISADETLPNDPRFKEQWALKGNLTEEKQETLKGINVITAWQTTTGEPSTVIAIIDSGVDFNHPDLRGNEWRNPREGSNKSDDDRNGFADDLHGWDWVARDNKIRDEFGHGTNIAGIIAASGNNASGITGVMWNASLMSLRVLDSQGVGDVASAVEAIDYATTQGAHVINCSWGTDENSAILRDALERSGRRNILVVSSAGNDSRDIEQSPYYPASYGLSNVLVVASTDSSENLASWSNLGREHIQVAAPGENILTTSRNGNYEVATGTSASAAIASGVAGLVKTERPYLSAERTREVIVAGARPVGALKDKVSSGSVIDAAGAIVRVNALPPNEGRNNNPGNGQGGNGGGGGAGGGNNGNPVAPPDNVNRTKGAPGPNLPNLDLMRNKKPEEPKAPPPIPSTRCPLQNPDCGKKEENEAGAVIKQSSPSQGENTSALVNTTDRLNGTANFFASNLTPISGAADLFDQSKSIVSDSIPAFNLYSLIRNALVGNFSPSLMPQSSSSVNLAVGRYATQSTDPGWGGQPVKAVDGNTSGQWYNNSSNSVTHTNYDAQAWWQVDLGSVQAIEMIKVWNRTDCCVERLSNFYVFVSDTPFASTEVTTTINQAGVSSYYTAGTAPTTTTININRTGRFVRVQLTGTDYLSLAEVQVLGTPNTSSSVPRLDPVNRAGHPGVDLLSRNYNWSIPLVSLKGRAGLDLGLSLAYNSLVWTKSGSTIMYDSDYGFPSPGFRLGFPVIQNKYLNAQGVNSYLMITPSGSRVELRQVGTYTYESADSSYLQLTESGTNLYVLTKDGTRLWYQPYGSDYQCTQIRDRNGNYISVSYNGMGRITRVTDTVGRYIDFIYDGYQNLIQIIQSWRRDSQYGPTTETHVWASFGWSNLTIQTSFSGLTLLGVQNGQTIPVLTQVGLADGSRYNFEYTSWGQVTTIRNYAADNTQLNYVNYNLDTSAGQTDCPRFTQQRVYARDWNNNAEAVTTYSAFNPAIGWADANMPDGITHREYFYTSGWQNGLTYQNELWANSIRRQWSVTYWTQDNIYVNYQLNPRPYDIRIYDEAGNQRRTTIDYTSYGLPSNIREYAPNGTVLRRRETQYRFDNEFVSKHILGVVWMEILYEGESTVVSKLNYHHDWDYWAPSVYSNGQAPSVGFDAANYSSPFFGRANITGVYRYNVNAPNDPNQAVLIKRIGYNLAGEPFFTMDASDHRVSISYADSYSDGNNSRNTLAYPTTITDGDNYSSTIQYNYDMGVPVRTQDPKGAIQTLAYDGAGRTEKVTNQINGAYSRWVFINSTMVQQFTTVQSGAGEAYSITVFDGAGRVRATGGGLPNSSGGYRGQYFLSDVMGRVYQQSNPTEITSSWSPAGDDAAGWAWSYQQYDWKGRPTVTTNVDGTTKEASYSGCGCAGGEVVTLKSETLSQGNRRQKIYKDVLGRVVKTEVLNWDQSVYSAVVNSYNARDQITNVRQYAGAEGSSTYQDTVMTYDGFGRLSTRKVPAQTSPTSYSYYADDSIQTVTDARGAAATFTYNARHLVTNITYSAPTGITVPAAVSFGYDLVGNRTSMTDGSGSTTYQYNTLSQLQSETRTFSGLAGSYTLSYGYNLVGQVTSVTDPFNSTINYSYDQVGRTTAITGTSFGGVTQYASNMQYRAWGALKHLDYGNTRSMDIYYNARLQPTSFGISGVMSKSYQYNPDGTVSYSQDYLDNRFDRSYSYDHAGRVTQALSGPAARGLTDTTNRPYNQTYTYDALNHLIKRGGQVWSGPNWTNFPPPDTVVNDRVYGYGYDAEGNLVNTGTFLYTVDAAGRVVRAFSDGSSDQTMVFDGDGQRTRIDTTLTHYDEWGNPMVEGTTRFEVRSSVLGAVVTEIDYYGAQKARGFVYGGGSVLAVQQKAGTMEWVEWQHRDASGATFRVTVSNAGVDSSQSGEIDPLNRDAGARNTYMYPRQRTGVDYTYPGFVDATSNDCMYGGMSIPCSMVGGMLNSGFGYLTAATGSLLYLNQRGEYEPLIVDDLGRGRRWVEDDGPLVISADGDGSEDNPYRVDKNEDALGHWEDFKQSPCESFLASLFTDNPKAIFVDVYDGDGSDPTRPGKDMSYRPYGSGLGSLTESPEGETHNHIYNSSDDILRATNIYAPGGGVILDSGKDSNGQNFINIYYANFGKEKDVVLQIVHVVNFNTKLLGTSTGKNGVLLGQMGDNGSWTYQNLPGSPGGYHVHINAMKAWWRGGARGYVANDKRKNATPNFQAKKFRQNVKLSLLCQ